MDYKRLLFIAPAWRESLDPATGTLVLRADLSSRDFCETIVTPIPGTDPVEFEYECLPVTCEGRCELQKRVLPDGTVIYFCACVDGSDGSGLAVRSSARARAGSSKGRKKTKRGKSR